MVKYGETFCRRHAALIPAAVLQSWTRNKIDNENILTKTLTHEPVLKKNVYF